MLVALKKSRIIFVTKFILFQFTREDRPEIVSFPLRWYSFVELWKLAQASTDFYPLALYVHEGRLFGTGVRSPSSRCRTTFALLRSGLRRDRFIPEIYFLLKRSRKRLVGGLRSFLAFSTAKFYDSKFRSLKNEFAPATKEGSRAKGKTTFEKRTIVLFYLNACTRGAHVKTLRGSSSFRHFFPTFFVRFSLRGGSLIFGLHPNRISWPRRFSISSSISTISNFLGKCISNLCLLDFDFEIFLYTTVQHLLSIENIRNFLTKL